MVQYILFQQTCLIRNGFTTAFAKRETSESITWYPAHGIEFDNNLMKEVLEMCDIYHTLLILIYIYSDYKSLFDSFSNFIFLVRLFSETENFIFFYIFSNLIHTYSIKKKNRLVYFDKYSNV